MALYGMRGSTNCSASDSSSFGPGSIPYHPLSQDRNNHRRRRPTPTEPTHPKYTIPRPLQHHEPLRPTSSPRPQIHRILQTISFHGERQLRHPCETLTYRLFGHRNREICRRVCNDFLANDNWIFFLLFTAFIPWVPQHPSQSTHGQPTRTEGHGQRTLVPQTHGHRQRTRTRTPTSGPSTQQKTSPEANNAATSS